MRLPKIDGAIDIPQVCQMVDIFLEAGFNYFDTAWAYVGSEEAIGKALVERYPRDAFLLATKAAPWHGCKSAEEAQGQFHESLQRTQAGYIDYYLMHNLGSVRTEAFDRLGMWEFACQKKEEGFIRHIGLSIHDNAQALEAVLDAHPEVEFVQLQVNYLDWENPIHQSRACLEVANRYGKPVVVMEPLRGGLLAHPPESVAQVFAEADAEASCTSWALRFAASQSGVAVVLSGMSDVLQVEENVRVMEGFETLEPAFLEVVEKAQAALEAFDLIPCTGCDYCAEVCPANIGISGALLALNAHTLFGSYRTEWVVGGERKGKNKPSECLGCGACEVVCPQQIPIVAELKRASDLLSL